MSSLIRLYPACYKGDIQAINAGSLDVHINLQYKKWKEAGKMVEDNHAHQTQIYKKKEKKRRRYAPDDQDIPQINPPEPTGP